ncbi:MAG TPA: carboxylesterase family protein [Acidobacteriaceae bacterium]|jgi:para-nitrobenzyl esterase|nr:carboxylesterase family protein [Acidobacteriaceae bacterium]
MQFIRVIVSATVLAFGLPPAALAAAAQVVSTDTGRISGVAIPHSTVTVFRGIPFAAPPVGNLRWRPTAPVHAWKGIRKADTFSSSCMQRTVKELLPWTEEFMTQLPVSEDCLYLNVWSPQVSSRANLPVIVFIHGGGFTGGAGSIQIYDGTNLAATGAVVVTINYRLGVFGFFAYPGLTAESDHHASGNYGLMDQLAALRWVRANIRHFGGDPARVTIWGQSAGAFSVVALTASPLGAGLFERAQADSGAGITGFPMQSLQEAEQAGVQYAEAHHAGSLEQLRALPAAALLPAPTDDSLRFAPDIDGWVLPATPEELSERGTDNDIPFTTGYQANDGMLFMRPLHSVAEYDHWAQQQFGDLAAEFLRLYPAGATQDVTPAMQESNRDRDRVSMFLWAARRTANHRQPIFTYFFDRAIPWPQHPEFGAFHTGEIPYFFRNLNLLNRPWEPVDHTVSREASWYLRNFAIAGDPNGDELPHWANVKADAPLTMEIGAHTGMMPVADPAQLAFWKAYFASPQGKHAPLF